MINVLRLEQRKWLIFRSAMAYQMTHRLIGMAVAILVVLWGLWVAHSPPNVRFVRVPVKDLPRPQIGVKLALLTDVHIGPSVGRTRVQQIVDLTNSLRPGESLLPFVLVLFPSYRQC